MAKSGVFQLAVNVSFFAIIRVSIQLPIQFPCVRIADSVCASRCMSTVYDINMHRGSRVRSVTNRVLIMNENNTRTSISKLSSASSHPVQRLLRQKRAEKYRARRANMTPIITVKRICMLSRSSLSHMLTSILMSE